MKELNALLIAVLAIFIYVNFIRKNINLEKVKSKVNGLNYYVRKLPDKQKAADKLGKLSNDLEKLVNHVKDKDREGVKKLDAKFDPKIITENIPGSMYVAYSVNKGDELSICIRDKDTETFIEDNTVIFVAIHEMSHIMSKSTGHTPEFWDNMKYLLEQGSEIGIYNPIDYSKLPVMYCGQEINSTPMDL